MRKCHFWYFLPVIYSFSQKDSNFWTLALHMVSLENFVKSMTHNLLELKITPSFCFANKIPDNVTTTSMYLIPYTISFWCCLLALKVLQSGKFYGSYQVILPSCSVYKTVCLTVYAIVHKKTQSKYILKVPNRVDKSGCLLFSV